MAINSRTDACDSVVRAQRRYQEAETRCEAARQVLLLADVARSEAKAALDAEQKVLLDLLEKESDIFDYAPPDPYVEHVERLREANQNLRRLQEEAREAIQRARVAKELIEGRTFCLDSDVLEPITNVQGERTIKHSHKEFERGY